jgi:4-hydroxy-4-methyl-2-oxoglutarate aldolase
MRTMQEICNAFLNYPSGNICDANSKTGNMSGAIKPLSPAMKVAGQAFTVDGAPGDNLAIHKAIYEAPPGSVLVNDVRGHDAGHFGEILASACLRRGIAGVILDGGCRDSLEIIQLRFPFFARSLNPGGTIKRHPGKSQVEITCGGIRVRPGDFVVGDADGVVVVEKDNIATVLEKTIAIAEREKEVKALLQHGKTTLEIFRFDALIREGA